MHVGRAFAFAGLLGLAGCAAERPGEGGAETPTPIATPANECRVKAAPGADFGNPIALSELPGNAFVPSIAVLPDGHVLVAWHEFVEGVSRVVYTTLVEGCAGEIRVVPETLSYALRPSVAATESGFVIAWQAREGGADAVRAMEVDAEGEPIGAIETIAPGPAAVVKVAAAGGTEAFSWTNGTVHSYAMRGAETVPPTPVGTTLLSGGQINFPRIALREDGTLFLAYRDGGPDTTDWEALLVTRPAGGVFGIPVNVSQSPGMLSDDLSLALEDDGTLHIAWVDQDPIDVNSFDVYHATRSAAGALSPASPYGKQGTWAWTPAVSSSVGAVWQTGSSPAIGPIWFGTPGSIPQRILGDELGGTVVGAQDPSGNWHLVYTSNVSPREVRYAWRR